MIAQLHAHLAYERLGNASIASLRDFPISRFVADIAFERTGIDVVSDHIMHQLPIKEYIEPASKIAEVVAELAHMEAARDARRAIR